MFGGKMMSGPITGLEVPTPTKFEDSMILHVAYNNKEMCQDEYRWEFYKREMGYGSLSGQPSTSNFGTNMTNTPVNQFGGVQSQSTVGVSGTTSGPGLFGSSSNTQFTTGSGLFGSNTNTNSTGLFGSSSNTNSSGLFGSNTTNTNTGLFGSNTNTGLFGSNNNNTSGFGQSSNQFGFGNFQSGVNQPQSSGGMFSNISGSQSIVLDKNHALGALVDSVDFDSLGSGSIQFWTNNKTELSVNEQIANESNVVPTFTSVNVTSPYMGSLPDFENRFDPYNLEPILKQIGKPNKIYHLMEINEMKPTFNIDYSTVNGQEFSSMFHIGESEYVSGRGIQPKSHSSLNNVLKKFWDKSLTANVEDFQRMKAEELSSGALLFTKQSNRNPFVKSSQFKPVEIRGDSSIDFEKRVDISRDNEVQHFSLDSAGGVQSLADKLLSRLNDLQASEVGQMKLISPGKSSCLCAPKLTKSDYYTVPSIESMSLMTEEQLSAVCDLTIRHEKFGEVLWPGFTDVREMDFDKMVEFSYKSLCLYKDMTNCIPPAGHGLNKTAIITLYKCVPTGDFSEEKTREIVKNMEAYTKSINCEFISASTETGSWKFKSIADRGSGAGEAPVYTAHLWKFVC